MMKLFRTTAKSIPTKGKYILLDTNVLSYLYKNRTLIDNLVKYLDNPIFMSESITEFEFLRGVFLPQSRVVLKKFLRESFLVITRSENPSKEVFKNAMLISMIYNHKKILKSVGFADLLIAGQMVLNQNTLFITQNIKDFPSILFDTKGVLISEHKSGEQISMSILQLSGSKFESCLKDLEKLTPTQI